MCLCYALGHVYYSLLIVGVGFKCYFELIQIQRVERKDNKLGLQTIVDWYAPLAFCFYLIPHTLIRRIQIDNDSVTDFKTATPLLYNVMFKHHTLISGMLLILGLVLFTLSLEKGYYRYQFKRLGWQIVCTLVTIPAGLFFGFYVFKGYFWVLMTNGSVMINDIMAYIFGKTFGRTKLIQLSPNKTVEGFIGGAFSTMLFAIYVSQYVSQFKQIICPQKEINLAPFAQVTCVAPELYKQRYYDLPINIFGTS